MRHPADEFAELSAEIARLQARREALREGFINQSLPIRSNLHEVTVRVQTRRVLDKSLLPAAILSDPKYYKVSEGQVVTVRAMRADRAVPYDDFDVIERD